MINTGITNEKLNHRLSLVAAPSEEPVTLEEVKNHLKIDTSDEDTLLTNLITVARQLAESYTRIVFITQTWKMFLDDFPIQKKSNSLNWWSGVRQLPISILNKTSDIELPLPPLQSITHIKTYDNDNVSTIFDSDNYYVSTYDGYFATKGRITIKDGVSWPDFTRNADGIEIQFVAGYGAKNEVPQQIKQALLEEIAYRYENRGECKETIITSPVSLGLLDSFRVIDF
jgi:uncharacterized phiE125 gp8 family phage protein